jgi:hypothetical protein
MLREVSTVQQIEGQPHRRWFVDGFFDLTVWSNQADIIIGFQLIYNKDLNAHAVTWERPSSFLHTSVDQGDDHPLKPKASPILVPDGTFDTKSVAVRFRNSSSQIDPLVADFVYGKLLDFRT